MVFASATAQLIPASCSALAQSKPAIPPPMTNTSVRTSPHSGGKWGIVTVLVQMDSIISTP